MSTIKFDQDIRRFVVNGELSFNTVPELFKLGQQLMEKDNELVFDFKATSCRDSSGLALLTDLMRAAKMQRKSICFIHVPHQLLAVAAACNLDSILPIVRSNDG